MHLEYFLAATSLSTHDIQYPFLFGFMVKVVGAKYSVTESTLVFSSYFGTSFLLLRPVHYAEALVKHMQAIGSQAYLVNTDWNCIGTRISIKDTLEIIKAIMNSSLDGKETFYLTNIQLAITTVLLGVDACILDPRNTCNSPEQWCEKAKLLAQLFIENPEWSTDTSTAVTLAYVESKL